MTGLVMHLVRRLVPPHSLPPLLQARPPHAVLATHYHVAPSLIFLFLFPHPPVQVQSKQPSAFEQTHQQHQDFYSGSCIGSCFPALSPCCCITTIGVVVAFDKVCVFFPRANKTRVRRKRRENVPACPRPLTLPRPPLPSHLSRTRAHHAAAPAPTECRRQRLSSAVPHFFLSSPPPSPPLFPPHAHPSNAATPNFVPPVSVSCAYQHRQHEQQ